MVYPGSVRRVIYIEDNAANLALVRKVLESNGRYIVTGAKTGEEGLSAVLHSPPDVILLDLDLPDIDGFEVARRLTAHPDLSSIPIIAISASVLKRERERSLAAGCTEFIEKPFEIANLRTVVSKTIERRSSPA